MDSLIIGSIMWVAFAWAPQYTFEADGRCVITADHIALYSVIENRYGGPGRQGQFFCLPDLRPKRADGSPDPNWNNGPRAVIVWNGYYPSKP